MPPSQGAFPIFPTVAQKKKLVSEFIECEKDCKDVKLCGELLKRQLIESIQDADFLEKIPKEFEDPHNMTKLIDKYLVKQERCQRLLVDSETPLRIAQWWLKPPLQATTG